MIGNDVIQRDFIISMKTKANIVALLNNSGDIKEDQYQGKEFEYPAVRVDIKRQTPMPNDGNCDLARLMITVRAYAEGSAGSTEADEIVAAVSNAYHRRMFPGTGYKIPQIRSTGLIAAKSIKENLWVAGVLFEGMIAPSGTDSYE